AKVRRALFNSWSYVCDPLLIDKPETCTCQGSEAHFANMAVAIDQLKIRYFIDPKLGNVFVTAACTTLFYSTTIQR
ncbi:hypothetical protein ACM615_24080, partial [Rahnella sp. PAMC25617]|uniref:hypothetical protein n=1 Tax=Rahnella sp. PAMC25617 TaxID=3399684 RepID=UPI003D35D7E1